MSNETWNKGVKVVEYIIITAIIVALGWGILYAFDNTSIYR